MVLSSELDDLLSILCVSISRDQKWEDVKVGQIILVFDGEEVPADCICLHTAVDNTCYVKTANLDGETNLKIKSAMRGVELTKEEADDQERHIELGDFSSRHGHAIKSSTERTKTMRDKE